MQIMIPVEVTKRTALDIISTALEGGIGYWSAAHIIQRGPITSQQTEIEELDYVITDLYDAEDPDEKLGTLTVETIYEGIALAGTLATDPDGNDRHAARLALTQLLADDIDAEGADVLVQLGLLGEVVYG